MTNRTMHRQVLRGRIYQAAITEFRARGYDGATVETIALGAGVAKGTLFNFYRSKLDVLIEYYWELDSQLAPLRKSLDARRPVRALTQYADEVDRLITAEGRLGIDLLMQTMSDGTLGEVDRRSGEDDEQDYARFFERCRDAGTIGAGVEPSRAAVLFLDIWSGSVRRWLAGGRTTPLSAILKSRLDDIFAGIGPKEG